MPSQINSSCYLASKQKYEKAFAYGLISFQLPPIEQDIGRVSIAVLNRAVHGAMRPVFVAISASHRNHWFPKNPSCCRA